MKSTSASIIASGAVLLLSVAGASTSFAKAHDNGLTNPNKLGTAGRASIENHPSNFAGSVDNLVSRGGLLTGGGTYGSVVKEQAQSGTRDRSDHTNKFDSQQSPGSK